MITYSSRSNARRAAGKQFGPEASEGSTYQLVPVGDGRFAVEAMAETSTASQHDGGDLPAATAVDRPAPPAAAPQPCDSAQHADEEDAFTPPAFLTRNGAVAVSSAGEATAQDSEAEAIDPGNGLGGNAQDATPANDVCDSAAPAGSPAESDHTSPDSASPASEPVPASVPRQRKGTKQALLVALLRRPEGVTVTEAMQATGWLSHTVRGAMAGALKKRLGMTLTSDKVEGRGRVYRVG